MLNANDQKWMLTVLAEALRPSMPAVADALDEAAQTIEDLRQELDRAYSGDR